MATFHGASIRRRQMQDIGSALVGLVILGSLAAVDLVRGIGMEGTFVLAPLVVALIGSPRATGVVAIAAIAAGLMIGGGQSSTEVQLTKSLVILIGSVIAVGLSFRQKQARAEASRAMLLERVASVGDRSLSLEDTVNSVVDIVLEEFADGCSIQVLDEQGLRVLTDAGSPAGSDETESWSADQEARSNRLFIPLVARNKTLGALALRRQSPGSFSVPESQLAASLANRIARSLDNAGLFDEFDSLSRRLDTVVSMLDEGVLILNSQGRVLFVNDAVCDFLDVPPDAGDRERRVEAKADQFAVEMEDGREFGNLRSTSDYALKHALAWDGIFRLLDLGNRRQRWVRGRSKPILSARNELLWFIVTLEDVDEIKSQEIREKILARIGRVTRMGVAGEEIFQRLAESVVPTFSDSCWVYLPTAKGFLDAVGISHRDPDGRAAMEELNRSHSVRLDQQLRVVASQKKGESAAFEIEPEMLREIAEDEEHLDLMKRIGNSSGLIVPLREGSKTVGVMAFGNRSRSRRFNDRDRETAERIGVRCAEIINRERQDKENAEVAKILRLDLKPAPLPSIPGVETSEIFQTANRLSQVGGDFYEGFETDDCWYVIVGDVVGRGAAAAALSLEARDTIRVALQLTGDHSEAFKSLDRRLKQRKRGEQVTVAVTRLPKTEPGALLVASAGHPLPVLADPDGQYEEVGRSGPILGLGIDGGWPETRVGWDPASTLIIYTDGISEARRADGTLFGTEGIGRETGGARRAAKVARAIEDSLLEFVGEEGAVDDDAAAVLIQRLKDDLNGSAISSGG